MAKSMKPVRNIKTRIVTGPYQKVPKAKRVEITVKACCSWKSCTEKFDSILTLDGHIEEHLKKIGKSPYRCQWDSCDFSCTCLAEFKRHAFYHGYHTSLLNIGREECRKARIPVCAHSETTKNALPELKQDFDCLWLNCKRSFMSIVEFQEHIFLHSTFDYEMLKTYENTQPKAKCNWQYCKKTFSNKYRLVEHTRMHSNQKLYGCYQCGELFRTKTTLFDHCRRQESNNTQRYQCGQCYKFYPTEKLLRKHVVVHVNCFKCSMCDMTCNSSNTLATHIRYRHIKDRPIKCPECDYSCVTRSDMAKHKRHMHVKLVQHCAESGCSYAVKTISALRRHYLEVHANSPFIYFCHCCEKLFKHGCLLSKHLIAKHNFHLPSGHKRFTYRIDENGFYSLETTRIESLEVTRQILSPVMFEVSELTEDSTYEIVSFTKEQTEAEDEADTLKMVTISLEDGTNVSSVSSNVDIHRDKS